MAIIFEKVTHNYQKARKNEIIEAAIEGIDLKIEEKGEFIAIIGQTGSGKSTLVQHINGLLLPTSGSLEVLGFRLTPKKKKNPKLIKIRKKIGFVFQFPEYQLFAETVLKDIMYGPLNFGFSEEEAKKNAMHYASLLQIEDILDKSPFNISGGQMRKVAIAGILSYEPEVLLLDEPTRGLDPQGAREIMELFNDLHKKQGKTIIMITHDMDLVYHFATRVIVLKNGKVVGDGPKEEIFSDEKNYLKKPTILKIIDEINEKMNYSLSYKNHNMEDLLSSLRKEALKHE